MMLIGSVPRRAGRGSRFGTAATLLVVGLAACSNPLVPVDQASEAGLCPLPTALSTVGEAPAPRPLELRAALEYAAFVAGALDPSPTQASLGGHLSWLGSSFGAESGADCAKLVLAWDALEGLPAAPPTLPDRAAIRLILEAAARALLQAAP